MHRSALQVRSIKISKVRLKNSGFVCDDKDEGCLNLLSDKDCDRSIVQLFGMRVYGCTCLHLNNRFISVHSLTQIHKEQDIVDSQGAQANQSTSSKVTVYQLQPSAGAEQWMMTSTERE